MANYNHILVKSTRATSHIGCGATVRYCHAKIGEDYGLTNLIIWKQVMNREILPEDILNVLVCYEDGMTFGPFVAIVTGKSGAGFEITHPSTSGREFSMTFRKK